MASIIHIANHMSRPWIAPRVTPEGIQAPLTIQPGYVGEIPSDLWEGYKSTDQVKHLISIGGLSEVRSAGEVPVYTQTTSDPEVPEHLRGEDHVQGETAAGVKRKRSLGSVGIDLVSK